MPIILLVDNGSIRPAATLQLRLLAKKLSDESHLPVQPVSLQHADKIPAEDLDGLPAQIFRDFMSQQLLLGHREFILLPLFFSKSKALTSFIPAEIKSLKDTFDEFSLTIADVIYPLPQGEELLSHIIYEHIINTANSQNLQLKNIVLVDHGSPSPHVTKVRTHLADTIDKKFPDELNLEQAVMERREGPEYDFNGQLLETWLTQKAISGEQSAIVSLMFFLAGRHAGEGGDIVDICQSVMSNYPEFKIAICPLISDHDLLITILNSRIKKLI